MNILNVESTALSRLYVPSPFDTCGLKQETVSALKVKVFGHAVYERITNISNIDTSVIVVNFSCFYQTRYKVGLRPDEGLSALFRPLPNRFSKCVSTPNESWSRNNHLRLKQMLVATRGTVGYFCTYSYQTLNKQTHQATFFNKSPSLYPFFMSGSYLKNTIFPLYHFQNFLYIVSLATVLNNSTSISLCLNH